MTCSWLDSTDPLGLQVTGEQDENQMTAARRTAKDIRLWRSPIYVTVKKVVEGLTLCSGPHWDPPCAASRWGPGQGQSGLATPLPHDPFLHSLLWFCTQHLRGYYTSAIVFTTHVIVVFQWGGLCAATSLAQFDAWRYGLDQG